MLPDLRFALRLLRRNPGFAAAAILTIALGVGLNGAVFALVRSVLLRPLPFHDPDRVVVLWRNTPAQSGATRDPSDLAQPGGDFLDWRAYGRSFDSIAGVVPWTQSVEPQFDLITSDRTERLRGAFATPNIFRVLGVHGALGRVFSPDDGSTVLLQEAVISDGLWRRSFGSDPAVVGRTMHVLGGRPRGPLDLTIIGVLPPNFRYAYPDDTEVWVPAVEPRTRIFRGAMFGQVIARLAPGVTPAEASSELSALEVRMAAAHPNERHANAVVATPFRQALTRTARPLLVTLGAVAVCVLLIACVNVANLLLARSVARGRELAIRTALGAGRGRLLRQITIECALLGALGGTVGLAALLVAMPIWQAVVPTSLPRGDEIRIDASVLIACAAAACAATFIGALAAFVFGTARATGARLKEGGSGQPGGPRAAAWRRAVVAVQVAVVFTLLVGAALLLESFWRLSHVDLGYDGRQVLTMEMRVLGSQTGSDAHIAGLQSDILDAVRALPGVTEAAMTSAVPMRGVDWTVHLNVARPGQPANSVVANLREVSPEYFDVMRIPLLAGRRLDSHDTPRSAKVAVVSQAFARILAADEPVIGRRLSGDRSGEEVAEIVGVVGDVRTQSIAREAMPAIYVPRAQAPSELLCLVMRTAAGQLPAVVAGARAVIHRVAPMLPVEHVTTLDAIVSQSMADRRFDTAATSSFAGVALLLVIVGLAGVVSRSISERTREIAVRAALGADGRHLRRMIVSQALRPVVIGLGAGLVTASWLTKWLETQLYQVHPRDPLTFAGAVAFLALVAATAAYVPARAATHIDPMEALRAD